jgi:hypothetical protein
VVIVYISQQIVISVAYKTLVDLSWHHLN